MFLVVLVLMNRLLISRKDIVNIPKTVQVRIGLCKGRFSRYFCSASQKWEQFYYGGCLADDNSFNTLSACEENAVI